MAKRRRHRRHHITRKRDHNMFMWGTIFVVLIVTGLLLWHWHNGA